ncbi:MAG: MoaD/ThiS family protein [Dehalococcoidia bacterium]|nr:MoaD/ThiS family protein [Dehalococcoidia bacterium]
MAVEVRVTSVLQRITGGRRSVKANGDTVGEMLDDLEGAYPGLKAQVTDDGALRRFVNIYVNDEDIRYLDALATPLKDGDVVSILPALAGG